MIKSAKAVRIESTEKMKSKKDKGKSEEAIKKGFKNNFLTVKFKLSALHVKAGTVPDFALFVKDDVHDPSVTNSAKHAGMYLSYFKGDIGDKFFSKQGIRYNPRDFYVCENEIDFREDRIGPFLKTNKDTTKKSANNNQHSEVIESPEEQDDIDDDISSEAEDEEIQSDSNEDEDVESTLDLFDMQKVARKVSWGAPNRESSAGSVSSAGVNVYGRGAEKSVDKGKKKNKSDDKKQDKVRYSGL